MQITIMKKSKNIFIIILTVIIALLSCGCSSIETLGAEGKNKVYLAREKENLDDEISALQLKYDNLNDENEKLSKSIEDYEAKSDDLAKEKRELNKELTSLKEEYKTATAVGTGVSYAAFTSQLYFLCTETEDFDLVNPYIQSQLVTTSDGYQALELVMARDKGGNVISKYTIALEQDTIHIHSIEFTIRYNDATQDMALEYNATYGVAAIALIMAANSKYEFTEDVYNSYVSLLYSGISNEKDIKYSSEDTGSVYIVRYEPAGDAELGSY